MRYHGKGMSSWVFSMGIGILSGCAPHVELDEGSFTAAAFRQSGLYQELLGKREITAPGTGVLGLPGLTAVLRERYETGTAVLMYVARIGSDGVDAWLVDEKGIRAAEPLSLTRDGLEADLSALRCALYIEARAVGRAPRRRGVERVIRTGSRDAAAVIDSLTSSLFPTNMAASLKGIRHLTVVPAFGIGAVPFAVLRPYGRPLIEDMTVTIAPNLSDLECVPSGPSALTPALIVGDPALDGDPDWIFPPLPGARGEATSIAIMLGAVPLLGWEASIENVLHGVGTARLVYLATHAVALPNTPLESFVALAGDRRAGRWTAREIQQTPSRADIVVLSACQTGLGFDHEGGMIGLARAFRLAGAGHVVMSLWNVDDLATERLMVAFARALRSVGPAEAMRSAMLDVRKEIPDPSKWASFVVFGTPPATRRHTGADAIR